MVRLNSKASVGHCELPEDAACEAVKLMRNDRQTDLLPAAVRKRAYHLPRLEDLARPREYCSVLANAEERARTNETSG